MCYETRILSLYPVGGGLLFAQARTTTTTTTKTTWNGTLVDATCQNTKTERRETTQINPDRSTTRTETTRTENVECPVTASTVSFGLMTSDGRFIRFDNPSNTQVVEFVRSNKSFGNGAPLRVSIVGTSRLQAAISSFVFRESECRTTPTK